MYSDAQTILVDSVIVARRRIFFNVAVRETFITQPVRR